MKNVKSNTCIVALKYKNKIYMGGDRLMSDGYTGIKSKEPKVFAKEDVLFGITGDCIYAQLMKFMPLPPKEEGLEDDVYIMRDLAITSKMKIDEFMGDKKDNIDRPEGVMLIGYQQEIYLIYSSGDAIWIDENHYTIGCGGELAMGSLESSLLFAKDPKKRIILAIRAATKHSVGVGGHIDIISI